MNILFYLVPKHELVYLYDDFSVRQAMEKLENHRFSCVPVINRKGNYVGSLSEGDILWELKEKNIQDLKQTEEMPIRQVKRCRDNEPVNINCNMEDLVLTAMNQNFIPVIDDNRIFIGIVTRKSIISYCYEQYKKTCFQ
ncbi:MAG: CBS domain-containing protein [Lachnospiraceae bacterium]|nr:CBS domain-containing protein [Lachnospiraceae bacterium]